MKKYADRVFYWFEDNKFARERKDISRSMELMFDLADYIEDEDNFDSILNASGLLEDYKDIDDAENACEELIVYMTIGLNKAIGNPVDDLIKALKGAK